MERLGLADIAEQGLGAPGHKSPSSAVLKGGQARVILMNGRFVDGSSNGPPRKNSRMPLAHELGHVFFQFNGWRRRSKRPPRATS